MDGKIRRTTSDSPVTKVLLCHKFVLYGNFKIYELSGGKMYGNNDTLCEDTKYRNSSHKVLPYLEVTLTGI